jgi:predicted O-methyltransferase YrrM
MDQEWQERALEKLRIYFLNDTRSILYNNYKQKNYQWASNLSWENQANKLLYEHILPNNFEYKNMNGWYNENIKNFQLFNMMINYFNISYANQRQSVKVLEIGTYTGISLINIINQIPNSIGYGLDEWSENINYEIEKSFINNINCANLSNRIFPLKGNSHDILTTILLKNEKFDFIYLDSTTMPHLLFTDCYLAWNILNKEGIMVINNYLLNTEDDYVPLLNIKGENHKNSPHDAILDFMKKYKSEYKILHTSNRIFLQKL